MSLQKTRRAMAHSMIESLEARCLLSTTYFVTPGSGSNGPSGATIKHTLADVNALDLNRGDKVYLDGTASFSGTLSFNAADAGLATGLAADVVTVTSYGGRATINAGNGDAIYVENAAGFDISNLKLVGTSDDSGVNYDSTAKKNHPAGINFVTNDNPAARRGYVHISDIEATGFWQAGIYFQTSVKTDWSGYNSAGNGYDFVTIDNVWIHDSGNTGIEFIGGAVNDSTNVTVSNAVTEYNAGHAGLTHNNGSGIILSSVDGGVVRNSVASYNGILGYGGVGIWAWKAANITIEHSEAHHNQTSTNKDGGGFDLDGGVTNSILQHNYSHDNEGSGYGLFQYRGAPAWGNNIVRYNISRNDARGNDAGAISIWDGGSGIKNVDIYGNTIYMDGSGLFSGATPQAIQITTRTTNVHFYNNIIATRNGVQLLDIARGQSGFIFKGNDLWTYGGAFNTKWSGKTDNSLTGFQSRSGQTGNFSLVPKFVNNDALSLGTAEDFRLNTTSPTLKDKGVNLWRVALVAIPNKPAGPGLTDYFGSALAGNSDTALFSIGANEI